jgi:hypothetical protein
MPQGNTTETRQAHQDEPSEDWQKIMCFGRRPENDRGARLSRRYRHDLSFANQASPGYLSAIKHCSCGICKIDRLRFRWGQDARYRTAPLVCQLSWDAHRQERGPTLLRCNRLREIFAQERRCGFNRRETGCSASCLEGSHECRLRLGSAIL